ncbi:SUR7/PalI family-domain-containing protein [Coniochaeta sp. 2T2.1]|nr:SUR7/PalI family-domain-containing protein [Coniochaeta sp. 2T2.1]
MARTGFFHHIGTFLLFAATILLLVTTISSPVVNDIALVKVKYLNSRSTVTYGTFGYCANNRDGDLIGGNDREEGCSRKVLGYSPATPLNINFSDSAERTTRSLTKAMVLHPVATGLNFIAFVLALGAGMVGSLLASLVAALAFLVTAVIVIIDFVLFSIVKTQINRNSNAWHAEYSSAAWTLLVGGICSLLGAIVTFFTCCSGRMHRRRNGLDTKHEVVHDGYAPPVRTTRRRRWF